MISNYDQASEIMRTALTDFLTNNKDGHEDRVALKPYFLALAKINIVAFQELLCRYKDEDPKKMFGLTYGDTRSILIFLRELGIQIETGRSMERCSFFKTISFAVYHEQWSPFLEHAVVIESSKEPKFFVHLPHSRSCIYLNVPENTPYLDMNNAMQYSPKIEVLIPKGKKNPDKPVFLSPCILPQTPPSPPSQMVGQSQSQNGEAYQGASSQNENNILPNSSCTDTSSQSSSTELTVGDSQFDQQYAFDSEKEFPESFFSLLGDDYDFIDQSSNFY